MSHPRPRPAVKASTFDDALETIAPLLAQLGKSPAPLNWSGGTWGLPPRGRPRSQPTHRPRTMVDQVNALREKHV